MSGLVVVGLVAAAVGLLILASFGDVSDHLILGVLVVAALLVAASVVWWVDQ